MKEQVVLDKITELLTEVIGKTFMEEYDITLESTLTGDLEMESIEIVELSEKIKRFYGEELGFRDWMAKMSLQQLVSLTIGDIVNFIEGCKQLSSEKTA